MWKVNEQFAREADEFLWEKFPELNRRQLDLSERDAKYRKVWMDHYIDKGGEYLQTGHLRYAPLDHDAYGKTVEIFKKTDEEFFRRYPHLKGKDIDHLPDAQTHEKAWMDLYIEMGGNFVTVGKIRIASPGPGK
ncbi:MAG TPA: hypothetical protein VD993_20390 [Chitinophagaceae bacterium]|nr:hypothetical protein [Chitinophagaceae bacterium]